MLTCKDYDTLIMIPQIEGDFGYDCQLRHFWRTGSYFSRSSQRQQIQVLRWTDTQSHGVKRNQRIFPIAKEQKVDDCNTMTLNCWTLYLVI